MDRRFIEETFPIKEVGVDSSKEKSIRHGHISTLHMWWARRPLSSSRTTTYASLIGAPDSQSNSDKIKKFIIDLSKWENSSNYELFEKARKDILQKNGGKPPKVLDPFSGGGAIPLESLRLGCEVYANDYNPVSFILLKSTLEYPRKYTKVVKDGLLTQHVDNTLISDLKKWAYVALEESKKELEKFYPNEKDGLVPMGYVWARAVKCQNPSCGKDVPLMRQFWLVNKPDKKIALFPKIMAGKLTFEIVGTGYGEIPVNFNPQNGTTSQAISKCLVCGSVIDGEITRKLFQDKKSSEIMLAVILQDKGMKKYRVANDNDVKTFKKATEYLNEKRQILSHEYGMDPIPDEYIHTPQNKEYQTGSTMWVSARIVLYGFTKWSDLFNTRQKLALITFLEKIKNIHKKLLAINTDPEYAKIITTYLAIIFDRLLDKNSSFVVFNAKRESIEHVFLRHDIPVVWDYVELNPFSVSGWSNMYQWVEKVLNHLLEIPIKNTKIHITQNSAVNLPYDDNFFDAVFTDPPYYDSIQYALLSDFFYVWMKRILGNLYPEVFISPVTPKSEEIISDISLLRGLPKAVAEKTLPEIKTSKFFEEMLMKSFKEIYRVVKPDGIVIIVYAHKSTSGWETLINSLNESGFVVTAAWPLNTEMKDRLGAHETASLASSIYMVARKWEKIPLGFYKDVRNELRNHLYKKLDHLWNEGVSGADFFVSAIGLSIEVFGRYKKIVDDSDQPVTPLKLLEDVRRMVADHAIRKVLHDSLSTEISHMTKFYILWRWFYEESKVQYDDVKKLVQSLGINIEDEWNKGFIVKDKNFIKVLGPSERNEKDLVDSVELIDVLHLSLILWKTGNYNEIDKLLEKKGYLNSELFKRVATAISHALPLESTERKLIDGFLTKYRTEESSSGEQAKLF